MSTLPHLYKLLVDNPGGGQRPELELTSGDVTPEVTQILLRRAETRDTDPASGGLKMMMAHSH